jgi:hypothetical protein
MQTVTSVEDSPAIVSNVGRRSGRKIHESTNRMDGTMITDPTTPDATAMAEAWDIVAPFTLAIDDVPKLVTTIAAALVRAREEEREACAQVATDTSTMTETRSRNSPTLILERGEQNLKIAQAIRDRTRPRGREE